MDRTPIDTQPQLNPRRESTFWRLTIPLLGLVLLARIVYLVWLCPYELAADEAHYWEWSRRLDLSYYSKGPGVAWVIAPMTALFGISEWAVRLPTALAAFAGALLLARLATSLNQDSERTGLWAASLFVLAPVFYASAQFMTIDNPYYVCWILSALIAWGIAGGRHTLMRFFLLGITLGVGVLFKYTVLLLLPGLTAFFVFERRRFPPRRLIAGTALMVAGLLLSASPVLVWNAQHGWPTVAHLIGHAGLPGGDVAPQRGWHWNPLWTVGYALYPFVVLGPPITLLLIRAVRHDWRARPTKPEAWSGTRFALCTAAPITLFYGMLSLRTDIELNWAVAGLTVPLVVAARHMATTDTADRRLRSLRRWIIGYGIACAVLVSAGKPILQALSHVSFAGRRIPIERPLHRVSGAREQALAVASLAGEVHEETGRMPLIMASSYGQASLLAFYMPAHPSVRSATSVIGGRKSSYDYFHDTGFSDPDTIGGPAILIGANPEAWSEAFDFGRIRAVSTSGPVLVGYQYGGPARTRSP